jgi:hypothetical protein
MAEQTEFDKARKKRNLVIALALIGFILLVYLVTLAKMGLT